MLKICVFLRPKKNRKMVKKIIFNGHKKPFKSSDKKKSYYTGFITVSNKTTKSGEKYGFNRKWAMKEPHKEVIFRNSTQEKQLGEGSLKLQWGVFYNFQRGVAQRRRPSLGLSGSGLGQVGLLSVSVGSNLISQTYNILYIIRNSSQVKLVSCFNTKFPFNHIPDQVIWKNT